MSRRFILKPHREMVDRYEVYDKRRLERPVAVATKQHPFWTLIVLRECADENGFTTTREEPVEGKRFKTHPAFLKHLGSLLA